MPRVSRGYLFIWLLPVVLLVATPALAAKPFCGDGKCRGNETAASCPSDCSNSGVGGNGDNENSPGSDAPGKVKRLPAPYCGDGKNDKREQCDGGGETASCDSDCTFARCGDGTLNRSAGEACDDGNKKTGDGCDAHCQIENPPLSACNFDGTCNSDEDCIGCPQDCPGVTTGKPSRRYCCGRDTFDKDLCGDGCGSPSAYCGNGSIDPGEECDDEGESAICDGDCTIARCGDGYTNSAAGEQCDSGGDSAYCDRDCTYRICGDDYANLAAGEECDDGGESAWCDRDCTRAVCGDGTLNLAAGEGCDDGNITPGDGCDDLCHVEAAPTSYCGDGYKDPGEECDDGNTTPGDGCDAFCMVEPPAAVVPANQFGVGDSIGEGQAANGTIGSLNHQTVWSTGYDGGDTVNSLNERFESAASLDYYENNADRDLIFNHALSGAAMADFVFQAADIVAAALEIPMGEAGMITKLLGNNDVCAESLDDMTDPALFEAQYRAGLDVLAASQWTRYADIAVIGIPAIYWLWDAKRENRWCLTFVWPRVPCENLLANPADDCESAESRMNPDVISTDDDARDGPNCVRRKKFHAKIRDIYNPILSDVLQEYIDDGRLPNAVYIDVFDVRFEDVHVNDGDCFHPSEAGHALLADEVWRRTQREAHDPQ